MRYFFCVLPLFFLLDSCSLPVSIEEDNTIVECENTRFVKNLLKSSRFKHVRIVIGTESKGLYDEFNLSDNYLRVTDDYGTSFHFYLCEMISAETSGSYLTLVF